MVIKIIDSARKHGVPDDDIVYVIEHPLEILELEYDPQKLLYIGFDRSLRALEVVTVININGEEVVIHAMKATKKILEILEELKNGRTDI
ncbi:MAG: hypothetical protein Ta2G_03950 [Termitinemataceae bacterium]|nr:MAG: hypothetical protein Ta2G_03950 [Termitinemataceae bacterium]